jgi:hypothetical protein
MQGCGSVTCLLLPLPKREEKQPAGFDTSIQEKGQSPIALFALDSFGIAVFPPIVFVGAVVGLFLYPCQTK